MSKKNILFIHYFPKNFENPIKTSKFKIFVSNPPIFAKKAFENSDKKAKIKIFSRLNKNSLYL